MKQQRQTTGNKILQFLSQLNPDFKLPVGTSIMHPYKDEQVWDVTNTFYNKFYDDYKPRILMLAINPGRLGAGITGIPFTDPVRLQETCGIPNNFKKRKELSGEFIYEIIAAFGGLRKFHGHFMLSSLCPLGFVKEGKNVNYYDSGKLQEATTPFIIENTWKQKTITGNLPICLCIGEGKNYKYFCKLNEDYHFFSHILPLPHPRFIMQYKRKQKADYIKLYLEKLNNSLELAAFVNS